MAEAMNTDSAAQETMDTIMPAGYLREVFVVVEKGKDTGMCIMTIAITIMITALIVMIEMIIATMIATGKTIAEDVIK
jgi:hypothetical protein